MVVEIRASAQTLIEVNPHGIFRDGTQGHSNIQNYSNEPGVPGCWINKEADQAERSSSSRPFLRTKWTGTGDLPGRTQVDKEEQEITIFVTECPYPTGEDRPPSPPPYESIYAEPIYGDTGSSGGSSFYWTPPPSLTAASTSQQHISVLFNNTSISPPSSYSVAGRPLPTSPNQTPFDLQPELPPLPSPSPNKFSSIAKSAGRKLVKKLDYIRRFSRATNMEPSSLTEEQQPMSLPTNHVSSSSSSLYNLTQSSSTSTSKNVVVVKRSAVPRPRIPPPAPPPPSLPPKDFEKMLKNGDGRKRDEEDFEDSDFCDSDSELIRNFVSAVQPIYSMEEEPLYQYYTYGISLQPEDDYQPVIPKNLGLTLEMLMPRQGQRTLWCEIPEVTNSGILAILSDKQKQLQESIFEILTSEVSYLKSLDVLIDLFYENQDLLQVLSETDRAALFGNIKAVKESARSFLTELLGKWEESWYIQEVGHLIIRNTQTRFGVYVDYCRNKPYQDQTLQRLRSTSDEFLNVIKSIEEDRRCELLRMDSFLMLPMQRITRLPLLVNAIIQRTQNVKEKMECEEALKSLTKLVIECNDAARESQDLEETGRIMERLEFPRGLRPLRNPGQFILKGDFMKNPFDTGRSGTGKINWTFQKSKRTYYWLILFTQQLFIAKKRSSGKLEVVETISPKESHIKKLPSLDGISSEFQHYFMLHFEGREAIYFLASRTQSEVERWRIKLDEIRTVKELSLTALFSYQAEREDELSFSIGEVIRVSQKQPDGWYFGTTENGDEGWFPGNYAGEEAMTD